MDKLHEGTLKIIHGYEGLGGQKGDKYYPYQGRADKPGVLTIGRGHVLRANEKTHITIGGESVAHKEGLTLEQVDQLFEQDMLPRRQAVAKDCPTNVAHEHGALVSAYYNVGPNIVKLSPGVAHRAGNKKECAKNLLKYVISAGKPRRGLWRRRMTEALFYLTGQVVLGNQGGDSEDRLYQQLSKYISIDKRFGG